ncbi:hypothetical protein ACFLZG_06960, partial [Thermodesulfobacteriota bacterium]
DGLQAGSIDYLLGDIMEKFEYEITRHSADQFKQLVYFCTDKGKCNYNQIPSDQLDVLGNILNDKGSKGWELVQVLFGKDGMVAIWKKAISD